MQYKLKTRKGTLVSRSSGCWGALGRSDYYYLCEDVRSAMDTFSGIEISYKNYRTDKSYLQSDDYTAVVLTPEDGWGELFHKSVYNLMEYIVERSPFSCTFTEGTRFADCYTNNELEVRLDLCPAQITVTLLIWIRDLLRSSKIARTFDYVQSLGFEQGVAMCTALHHPYLYCNKPSGSRQSREAYASHGLEFWTDTSVQGVQLWEKYTHVFPYSMAEMGGYPVILIDQFNEICNRCKHKPKYGTVRTTTITVHGLFSDKQYQAVPDVAKFIKQFWGLK